MFQCFSGFYSALFDKSSRKERTISSIDLLASPQVKMPWQEFHSGSDSEAGEIAPLLTHS